ESDIDGDCRSRAVECVSCLTSFPFLSIDQIFIVPSRSERKYTRPLYSMGWLLVPSKSPVRFTASDFPSNFQICSMNPPLYRFVLLPCLGRRVKNSSPFSS